MTNDQGHGSDFTALSLCLARTAYEGYDKPLGMDDMRRNAIQACSTLPPNTTKSFPDRSSHIGPFFSRIDILACPCERGSGTGLPGPLAPSE